ncbi:cupin domain-containing protein [Candidatus Hodarchaeum mangrovi]
MNKTHFPEVITRLPEADIPIHGIKGWVAQGENFQIVFFEINSTGKIPPHSHSTQFGLVLEGEMSLTVDGKKKNYSKGETYFIPEGKIHQAEFHTRVLAMDFFDDAKRYKIRK